MLEDILLTRKNCGFVAKSFSYEAKPFHGARLGSSPLRLQLLTGSV